MDVEPPAAPTGALPPPPQPVPNQQSAGAPAPGAVPPHPPLSPAPPAAPAATQIAALGAGAAPVNVTFEQITPLLVASKSPVPPPTDIHACYKARRGPERHLLSSISNLQLHMPHQTTHKVYALTGEIKWHNFGNPSPLQLGTGGSLSRAT